MARARIIRNTLKGIVGSTRSFGKYVRTVKKPFLRAGKLEPTEKELRVLPKGLREKVVRWHSALKPEQIQKTIEIFKEAKKLPLRSRIYLLNMLYAETSPYADYDFLGRKYKMLQSLLTPNPKFKVIPFSEWMWPDKCVSNNVFVFYVKGFGKTAVFKIDLLEKDKEFAVIPIQGIKGTDMRKADKLLGQNWYEALMDSLIKSYLPLGEGGMRFAVAPPYVPYQDPSILHSKIRKKYLDSHSFLNQEKKSVRRIFEEEKRKMK